MPRGALTKRATADIRPAERALTESSQEAWRRWSTDRERRALQRKLHAEAAAREAANLPIYPRECAARLAEDTRSVAPDWRHMRPSLGPAWGRLLKAQPELAPDITRQREATITAVFNSVPRHLQGSVSDLRTLIDLLLAGHEAAAYQIGFEAGKLHAQAHVSDRGRIQQQRRASRADGDLRLHLSEGGR